jgi:CRP-like cAMP-binding protein
VNPDDLKLFSLMAEFSEDDRESLVELLNHRSLPDGKSIFREGAEGEGLVLLTEGRLKLKSRRTGSVLGVLEAPAHLGMASLFDFGKREVTAIADGTAEVYLLGRSSLPRLAEDAPRTAFRLAEAVARELAVLARVGLETLAERDFEEAP